MTATNASARNKETSRLCAIGSFFRDNPDRILAMVSGFRGTNRVIESKVIGESMAGSIPSGSLIHIRFDRNDSHGPGQVVAFLVGTRIIVHRVVYRGRFRRARNYVIAQGDNRLLPDPPVDLTATLGSVTEVQCEGVWRPVPNAPARSLKRRLISACLLSIIIPLLEIDVSLARRLVMWANEAVWRYYQVKNMFKRSGKRRKGAGNSRSLGRLVLFVAAALFCKVQGLLMQAERLFRRVHILSMRALRGVQQFGTAFFGEAMTVEEQGQLTVRLYNTYSYYRSATLKLTQWEGSWFRRRMPAAPSRILIGACGSGREALVLADSGFFVDAFEPARELANVSRHLLGDRAVVQAFRYEDLSSAVLEGSPCVDPHFTSRPYDAVLLGFGSLTHLLDPVERERLFRALNVVCPSGPILASFWCADSSDAGTADEARLGRGYRYGRSLGLAVASLRAIRRSDSTRLHFARHSGLGYSFTRAEIEALASLVGREVAWEDDNTRAPHVTFFPPKQNVSECRPQAVA